MRRREKFTYFVIRVTTFDDYGKLGEINKQISCKNACNKKCNDAKFNLWIIFYKKTIEFNIKIIST
jgi:hypothetical protein